MSTAPVQVHLEVKGGCFDNLSCCSRGVRNVKKVKTVKHVYQRQRAQSTASESTFSCHLSREEKVDRPRRSLSPRPHRTRSDLITTAVVSKALPRSTPQNEEDSV